MKNISLIFILFTNIVAAQTADTLTLFRCYEDAEKTYPLQKDKQYYQSAYELKMKNLNSAYMPSADLKAQATYQSDVTELNLNLPGPQSSMKLDGLAKDQYKAYLDVKQLIFDGGAIGAQKQIEAKDLEINQQQLAVDLYKLRERINQAYFSTLLLQEKEKLISILKQTLEAKLKILQSGFANGIIMQSDVDVLKAELLKVEQDMIEIKAGKQAGMMILSILTSKELNESNTILVLTEISLPNDEKYSRPEHLLFDMQSDKIVSTQKLISTKRMPKLAGFGQLGYGRPGMNMLSNEFDNYYIVGASLNWSIIDWNQSKREKQILSIQKDMLQVQRETFDKNLTISLGNEKINIEKYKSLIANDYEIIKLRGDIVKSASSKLENGVINSTDYITELNSEMQAKINKETHEIQLLLSKVNYMNILGK